MSVDVYRDRIRAVSGLGGAFEDVLAFHVKLAPQIIQSNPAHPADGPAAHNALGFIREELNELVEAMHLRDLAGVADGLADLIYVAIRAALIYGIDLRPVWAEVHRANMAKEGGPTREDSKILKPPGWVPPDIGAVLERQEPIL